MQDFSKILDLCAELGRELPDLVFIGGVAVYLHSLSREVAVAKPETSHDADFMISFAGYDVLKDAQEVVPTPRLSKHQMLVDDVEFDVYVERLHHLLVPYDEVYAYSEVVESARVACLEHLLVLKLDAYAQRGHSSKGIKDRRDVAKIGILLGRQVRKELVLPYMRDDLESSLEEVARSPVFFELCSRNSHEAKKTRTLFASFASRVLS
jgi:hypothetical protein